MMKIWLSGHDDCGQPTAYARLKDEAQVRAYYKGDAMVEPILAKTTSFSTLRCETHDTEGNVYAQIWGEDEPGFDLQDLTAHNGRKLWLDGKVVYNDLEPGADEDVGEHDPECEDCPKDTA